MTEKKNPVFHIEVKRSGLDKSGNYYSPDVLERSTSKFEAGRITHNDKLVGWIEKTRYKRNKPDHDGGGAIIADFHVVDQKLRNELIERCKNSRMMNDVGLRFELDVDCEIETPKKSFGYKIKSISNINGINLVRIDSKKGGE